MPFHFKTINELGEIGGKRVLVRVDFNLPMKNGIITDDFRIRKTLPTINLLKEKKAKIFLIGHVGSDKDETMKSIADHCNKYFSVIFSGSIASARSLKLN